MYNAINTRLQQRIYYSAILRPIKKDGLNIVVKSRMFVRFFFFFYSTNYCLLSIIYVLPIIYYSVMVVTRT